MAARCSLAARGVTGGRLSSQVVGHDLTLRGWLGDTRRSAEAGQARLRDHRSAPRQLRFRCARRLGGRMARLGTHWAYRRSPTQRSPARTCQLAGLLPARGDRPNRALSAPDRDCRRRAVWSGRRVSRASGPAGSVAPGEQVADDLFDRDQRDIAALLGDLFEPVAEATAAEEGDLRAVVGEPDFRLAHGRTLYSWSSSSTACDICCLVHLLSPTTVTRERVRPTTSTSSVVRVLLRRCSLSALPHHAPTRVARPLRSTHPRHRASNVGDTWSASCGSISSR
jgi:hypothetical protein